MMKPLSEVAAALADGSTSSRALTEEALARIRDPDGEGARTFLTIYEEAAPAAAAESDRRLADGHARSPLEGIPVSIKDLFDVAGEVTLAASVARDDALPEKRDAAAVARLKAAGAVIVGRTNMTEFAFSGVGLNPHYGTPRNPWDRPSARIPGGSSSGAAVSVADGMAAAAIGSDTGGSVRIPAALCGLTGFKPSQKRMPLSGVFPLSETLDTIGPLAPTVACCALIDAVLAGRAPRGRAAREAAGLRLAVPETVVLDDLDEAVAAAFERALQRLSEAGARIARLPLDELAEVPEMNRGGGIVCYEAYQVHRVLLERRGRDYDPRVRARIEAGAAIPEPDYAALLRRRADLRDRVKTAAERYDALVMPTTPMVAPPIAELQPDDGYWRVNRLMLRNTGIWNLLDLPAATLPCHGEGEAPVGLMVVGADGDDGRLLAAALGMEAALAPSRR
jgi:aspartyl-tRNA(Asn)/glutamyl-tRNA(Gln) amidotransferase subunit A